MKKSKIHFSILASAMLYTLMSGQAVLADDTEVLIGPGGQAWATPNVLFIMDTSGSMGWGVNSDASPTGGELARLEIVQNVFADLMNTNSGFNVALMRFDGTDDSSENNTGGSFITPMQLLNSNTRADIIAASNALTAGAHTPLAETLYEAALFYRGDAVHFGNLATPNNVTSVTDPENSANYLSPITSQCQANYVILLTDGEPTSDTEADDNIAALTGNACSGNCLDELASYLHNTDQASNSTGNQNIDGTQTVETYTIGFTTNQTLLEDAATAGGGDYITASNAAELSNAFSSILETITNTNNSFSPPAMAANAFNNISHYNRLYFTLFEPAASPKWEGNVKPYALNDSFELIDADDNVAVDNNGMFLETSRSFWSSSDDGGSISDGGANGQLPAADDRNLYTYTGSYDATGALASNSTLSNPRNALENTPSSVLDETMLGLTGATAATEFDNVLTTIRASTLSDPLHSKPALVNYGGTEENPDLTLFVATNAGFLHALDASTGVEQFAFIPQELLTNLPALANSTGIHPYGLDGDVTAWVNDSNNDGDVSDSGEHAFVYVGMRRGGNNYYALDVTNRNEPTLKWVIKGGSGGNADFSELGQTWSRPIVTTIPYATATGTSTRTVLIFGGGYDTAQDANPVYTDDGIGRAIYIVDADTGERLWWVGPTGSGANLELDTLTNSIPSDIKLLDSNLDHQTDRLYVGDMRGQIFRIDLQASTTGRGISGSGVRLANLGSTSATDTTNNRRFYYPPDIVITQQPGLEPYVSVNIGSGYRAHPLNPLNADGTPASRVNDRFYSLRDPNILGAAPSNSTVITDAPGGNLFDATSSLVNSEADITNLANSMGWYITLGNGNGEKVLASSITLNSEIFFSTYTPPTSVTLSDCAPPPGVGKLYRVNLVNATPTQTSTIPDVNGDPPTPTLANRVTTLSRPGIPSEPTVMFRGTEDGDVELIHCEGTECQQLPDAIQMQETYWRD